MNKNIKIFLAYHKPSVLIKNAILTPIHVGRSIAEEVTKDGNALPKNIEWLKNNMIGDSTGENISNKNRTYNELTAFYWVWKNYEEAGNPDYIGFMHYRRQLIFDDKDIQKYIDKKYSTDDSLWTIDCLDENELNFLFNEEKIKNSVENYDIVMPKPVRYSVDACKQYNQQFFHKKEDLDLTLDIIKNNYPEYNIAAKLYMKSHNLLFWNMFVMKKELFFEYCEFVFGVLSEFEKKDNKTNKTIPQLRSEGYIAERLLGIYITKLINDKKYKINEKYSIIENYTDIKKDIKPAFENNNIPVVYASNNDNAPYTAISLKSVIQTSNPQNNYDIIILENEISKRNKQLIKLMIKEKPNFSVRYVNMNIYIKDRSLCVNKTNLYEEYSKLYIPRIFKNYGKVIYLDFKTVILEDIAGLFKLDLKDNAIGATKDFFMIKKITGAVSNQKFNWKQYTENVLQLKNPFNYANTEAMIMDITKINVMSKYNQMLFNIGKNNHSVQDILNKTLEDDIEFFTFCYQPIECVIHHLPKEDYLIYDETKTNMKIIHFNLDENGWNNPQVEFSELWWENAKMTSFYEGLFYNKMQYFINFEILNIISKHKTNIMHYWQYKILASLSKGSNKKLYKGIRNSYKGKILKYRNFISNLNAKTEI